MSSEVIETETEYAVYTCSHNRGRGKRTILSCTLSRRSAWDIKASKRGGSFRIVLQAGAEPVGAGACLACLPSTPVSTLLLWFLPSHFPGSAVPLSGQHFNDVARLCALFLRGQGM